MAGAAVVVLALVAAGVGAIVYTSGKDEGGGGGTGASPAAKASTGQPQASQPAAPPLDSKLENSLRSAGYACYESAIKPDVVHSCYAEPGVNLNNPKVRIHSDPTGKIIGVLVDIEYYADAAAARTMFEKSVRALVNGVLTANDVDPILAPTAKGKRIQKPYSGGMLYLFASKRAPTFVLRIIPTGGRLESAQYTTKYPSKALNDRYIPQGFKCPADPKLKVTRCTRRDSKAFYQILGFDPCLDHEARFDVICEGKGMQSVVVSIGFAPGRPRQEYVPIFKFLLDGVDWAAGGWSDEARKWVLTKASDGKVHRGDFQQLHFEIKPGSGANGGFASAVEISVSGLILTPSQ